MCGQIIAIYNFLNIKFGENSLSFLRTPIDLATLLQTLSICFMKLCLVSRIIPKNCMSLVLDKTTFRIRMFGRTPKYLLVKRQKVDLLVFNDSLFARSHLSTFDNS